MNFEILMSIGIGLMISIITYIILKKKLFPTKKIGVTKKLEENDVLERYKNEDFENDDFEDSINDIKQREIEFPEDEKVEITNETLKKAFAEQHQKFLEEETNISESEVDQTGLIKFKNANAEKLKLLLNSENKLKESLARIQKSNYGKS